MPAELESVPQCDTPLVHLRQRFYTNVGKPMNCGDCREEVTRESPAQVFCRPCSKRRSAERKARYQKQDARNKPAKKKYYIAKTARARAAGAKLSEGLRWSLDDIFPDESGFTWCRKIEIGHTLSLSKNHVHTRNDEGHVRLRRQARMAQDNLIGLIKDAISGAPVVQNKVWIDLMIEKPDHRSDAINLVDLVCDSAKVALGVDDRWFCIHRLDWQIIKTEPRILLGLGQKSSEDVVACSWCGRLLSHDNFYKSGKGNKYGHSRECKECMSLGNKGAS